MPPWLRKFWEWVFPGWRRPAHTHYFRRASEGWLCECGVSG